jgi:DNA repair ATPase RecN
MGLVSGIIRLQYLAQTQLDLEYKLQTLSQTKMQLASQGFELVSIGSDLDPDSPEVKRLETRRQKLELMEKKIDAEILKYQNMLKMAETEMQSAQKIVDNSIKRSFSYAGGQ